MTDSNPEGNVSDVIELKNRRPSRFAALGVILLALCAFAPSLRNDFALDDALARAANDGSPNRSIAELRGPGYYFTSDYWDGRGGRSGLFRPVTIYSFALTHHLTGARGEWEATPHHVINVLLNGLAAYLVFWLMLDFGLMLAGAVVAAALFAVHGLHSEVVATVIGRGELFAFCFGMLGLMAFRKAESGRTSAWLALSGIAFFLGFGSKESALAWVGMLPCYLLARRWHCGGGAIAWRGVLVALLPGLVLFFVLRGVAIPGVIEPIQYSANPLAHADVSMRLLTALDLWGEGLGLCLAPLSLACLYGPQSVPLLEDPADFGLWLAIAVFVAWLACALRSPARYPGVFLSAAFFFGFSFLTSNVPFAIGTIFGERLFFTPSLGVCMLPALLLPKLAGAGRKFLIGVCIAWATLHVVVDVQRSLVWHDNETLFLQESVSHPDCALLQITAAKLFEVLEFEQPDRRDFFRARQWECMRRARQLDSEYVDVVRFEAGLLEREAQSDRAIATLVRALQMTRMQKSGLEAEIRKALGRLLITKQDQYVRGLRQAYRSLELRPGDRDLRTRIVSIGVQRWSFLVNDPARRRESAREIADVLGIVFQALPPEDRVRDQFITARMDLAESLDTLGDRDEAQRAYQEVLALPALPAAVRARAVGRLEALRK